jgi:outer membrane protein TolC
MRLIFPVILTFALLPFSAIAGTAAPPTVRLNFDQAVRKALTSSPTLQESRGQLRAAHGVATAAEGARWPHLSASLNAARSNNPLSVFGMKLQQRKTDFNDFGAGQFNPSNLSIEPRQLNYPGNYNNFNTQLSLKIPVWEGGELAAVAAAARIGLTAARAGNQLATQQVIFRLLQAYEGVRAARTFVRVAVQAEKAAASYVHMSRQMYAHGIIVRSNLLSAEVHLGDAQLHLAQARNALAQAREAFHLVMGVPADAPLDIGISFMPPMPQSPLTEIRRQALTANPGLHAVNAQRQMRAAEVSRARAAYKPKINLAIMADWNKQTLGLGARSYTAAASVTWELFDLGARRGTVGRALAAEDQMIAKQRAAREKLIHSLDDAYRSALLASEQIRVRTLAVNQASEAARILAERYQHGITTIASLLAGQAQLDQAHAELVKARYEQAVSRAAIWLAMGQLNLAHIGRWSGLNAKGEY